MDTDILKRFPRLQPFKRRVTSLKQHLTTLQQLPRRVKVKAANLGELNQLIQRKLERINNNY